MDKTVPTPGSPLARKLEELIQSGVVKPQPWSLNSFPTARVVVPVYDSAGTFMPNGNYHLDVAPPKDGQEPGQAGASSDIFKLKSGSEINFHYQGEIIKAKVL